MIRFCRTLTCALLVPWTYFPVSWCIGVGQEASSMFMFMLLKIKEHNCFMVFGHALAAAVPWSSCVSAAHVVSKR